MVDGARKATGGKARNRIVMTMAVFFGDLRHRSPVRLAYLGMLDPEDSGPPGSRVTASRPDIVDRNGEVLATDIKTSSLFAEPRKIVDADEAIEKIATVIPDLDYRADLPQAEERHRLRLAAAATVAEAAERHHEPRHSRHRLPHREAPLLSGRRDRCRTSSA